VVASESRGVTELLLQWRAGDEQAREQVMVLV
jgi:hypothetical protein